MAAGGGETAPEFQASLLLDGKVVSRTKLPPAVGDGKGWWRELSGMRLTEMPAGEYTLRVGAQVQGRTLEGETRFRVEAD